MATNGNDAWSGRLAQPNAEKSDGPLASLQGARDRLRALRKAGGPAAPSHLVQVQGGTYVLAQQVAFSAEDSGTAAAPVVYRAAPGALVRLSGGREVANWHSVTDAAVLARLPEEVRTQVQVADLRAQGITDFGKLSVRGFGAGNPSAEDELFHDDEPMTLARWPNRNVEHPRCGAVDRARMVLSMDKSGKPVQVDKIELNVTSTEYGDGDEPGLAPVFAAARLRNWQNPQAAFLAAPAAIRANAISVSPIWQAKWSGPSPSPPSSSGSAFRSSRAAAMSRRRSATDRIRGWLPLASLALTLPPASDAMRTVSGDP